MARFSGGTGSLWEVLRLDFHRKAENGKTAHMMPNTGIWFLRNFTYTGFWFHLSLKYTRTYLVYPESLDSNAPFPTFEVELKSSPNAPPCHLIAKCAIRTSNRTRREGERGGAWPLRSEYAVCPHDLELTSPLVATTTRRQ